MPDTGEHGRLSSSIKTLVDAVKASAKKLTDEVTWIFGDKPARFLGLTLLFVVVVVALFIFLNWYVAPTKPSNRKDLVLATAQILGGAALLSGLYFTWRTLQINQQGQITGRFTQAIEQLGATVDTANGPKPNMEMRLGGIHALERISRESPGDHWSIMHILTAYVRQHARLELSEALTPPEEVMVSPDESALALDIEAVMSVIRNRTRSIWDDEPEALFLSNTNLQNAFLEGAYLGSANLEWSRFWYTDFRDAHLEGAHLSKSDLRMAFLGNANLTGATLYSSNLGTDLQKVDLTNAKLGGADLSEAKNLTQEQLERTSGDENTKIPSYLERPASWAENPDFSPWED